MSRRLFKFLPLTALTTLAGCVVAPPPPPPLVAYPGPTKTAQEFAQDDVVCRTALPVAVQPIAPATGAVTPNPTTAAILTQPQSYLQCMQARGNIIQAAPVQSAPSYYAYPAYGYSWGDPWWGWGPAWGWGWGYGGGWGRGWGGWHGGGWGGWHGGGTPYIHAGHP